MYKALLVVSGLLVFVVGSAFLTPEGEDDGLRALYSRPITEWPTPDIDSGIHWQEFEALPGPDTSYFRIISQPKEALGKLLFFDPLLSGSNQISCSSCHDPQRSWADQRSVALGNDHLQGMRNTPSLLNVGARKSLFWDGRALTLESQVLSPIEAHHEMASDPQEIREKLEAIPRYRELFAEAYGDSVASFDRVGEALAAFQRTIIGRRSRFDRFVEGEYERLTDQEIKGLHLFRTKARCMNCHFGPHFTDEQFHNIGLTYYKRKYEDLGRYEVTKDPEDVGRFRTPSLRDVMHNDPWMHNGLFSNIMGVVNIYNSGMHMINPSAEEKAADPLYPVTDPILRPLELTADEKEAVVAFLGAITATQYRMQRPELPR
ncbi:cytochrome-c peroxidase [Parapedobacter sp. 10938]|uniref:cytochrome-c peroxidase n=1 Tax=Parapedobacter flavus TaxID=3110225 RepID=UPI002DBFDC88|nr:cytochrome c peroxidase [Parapedobacter sp. 10938]MEC3879693.1 cytochrome c peroxidase [Parapedobacter sp. 10938]